MLAMLADSGDLRILPHADELILATIAFGILVVFLLKAVFPRLKKALEDRTAKIQGQLEGAARRGLRQSPVRHRSSRRRARSGRGRAVPLRAHARERDPPSRRARRSAIAG